MGNHAGGWLDGRRHPATAGAGIAWLLWLALLPLALSCLLLSGLVLLPGLSEEYLAGTAQWRRCWRHMGGYR